MVLSIALLKLTLLKRKFCLAAFSRPNLHTHRLNAQQLIIRPHGQHIVLRVVSRLATVVIPGSAAGERNQLAVFSDLIGLNVTGNISIPEQFNIKVVDFNT